MPKYLYLWTRMTILKTDPHIYGNLTYDKGHQSTGKIKFLIICFGTSAGSHKKTGSILHTAHEDKHLRFKYKKSKQYKSYKKKWVSL